MWIGHHEEISKLMFRELALRRSKSYLIRCDEGLPLETSAFESLHGGQFTLSTQLIKPNYLKPWPYLRMNQTKIDTLSKAQTQKMTPYAREEQELKILLKSFW